MCLLRTHFPTTRRRLQSRMDSVVHIRSSTTQANSSLGVTQLTRHRLGLRIDADEYLTPELAAGSVSGCRAWTRVEAYRGRRMISGGADPHSGGPADPCLRLFRNGRGRSRTAGWTSTQGGRRPKFRGAVIDENLNSLTWWSDKHNPLR